MTKEDEYHHVPNAHSISQIALYLGGNKVSVRAPLPMTGLTELPASHTGRGVPQFDPLFWINGVKTDIEEGLENGLALNDGSVITRTSTTWIEIVQNQTRQLNSHGNKTQNIVRINAQTNFLNVYFTSDKPYRYGGSEETEILPIRSPGLGGTPNGDVNDDVIDANGTFVNVDDISPGEMMLEFAKNCAVKDQNAPIFLYGCGDYSEPSTGTDAGNYLSFARYNHTKANAVNETAENATSTLNTTAEEPVELSYISVVSDELTAHVVTLLHDVAFDFYVKLDDVDGFGVFFSYRPPVANAIEVGFDLAFIDSAIKLGVNGTWVETEICPPTYKTFCDWGMLVINCERSSGDVWLMYVTSSGSVIVGRRISSSEISSLVSLSGGGSVWFKPGGRITLGGGTFVSDQLVSGSDLHPGYSRPFVGIIDEAHFHRGTLSKVAAIQNFGIKFDSTTTDDSITGIWHFDEGAGAISRCDFPGTSRSVSVACFLCKIIFTFQDNFFLRLDINN